MSKDTTDKDVSVGRVQLEAEELAVWHALKKISATTASLIKAEIAPGISGADYSILSRLDELGGHSKSLGQSQLMSSLGWDKSRLSHQLTRMEERGLVVRVRSGKEADITLRELGARLLARARPEQARLIRAFLLRLTPAEAKSVRSFARKI